MMREAAAEAIQPDTVHGAGYFKRKACIEPQATISRLCVLNWQCMRTADLTTQATLQRFQAVARPIMLDVYPRRDNCIWATAVTIKVLSHFAIRARPLRCALGIYPAALLTSVEVYRQLHGEEPKPNLLSQWGHETPAMRSVSIGLPTVHDASLLHLAALVESAGHRYIVDAASDQAMDAGARAGSLIDMPPVVLVEVPMEFAPGNVIDIRLVSGAKVSYFHIDAAIEGTQARDWQSSKDWTNTGAHDQDAAVVRIIDAMQ